MVYQKILGLLLLLCSIEFGASQTNFKSCERNFTVNAFPGVLLKPFQYDPNCINNLISPPNTIIELKCFTIMNQGRCSYEKVFYSDEGNTNLAGTESFCTSTVFVRFSLFNRMTLGHVSNSSHFGGFYLCYAKSIPKPCDCGWTNTGKIVNGNETAINQYPSIVDLIDKEISETYCGGAIISPFWILTAAHCISYASNASIISAVVGEHNTEITTETIYTVAHDIALQIKHPLYNATTSKNDIGLLKTKTEIIFNRGVGPVCLPFIYQYASFIGSKVDEVGWGLTEFGGPPSDVLLKVTLNVISNSNCSGSFPDISSTQMCTYTPNKDSCQHDSGGPLYYSANRLYSIGVISFGIGCALNSPSVATRLTSYLNWIVQNTGFVYCVK